MVMFTLSMLLFSFREVFSCFKLSESEVQNQNYADVSCRCEKSDQKQKIESFTGKRSGNVYELPEI